MQTLTYGYKKPETGDQGPIVFPALEDNIQLVNDHTHNGVNSSKIPGSSLSSTTAVIASGSWSLVSGGRYKQTVNMPGGFDYDTTSLEFRLPAGHVVHPSVEKVSSTSYDVYFVDNTSNLNVLYN